MFSPSSGLRLNQNIPNPFKNSTLISFDLKNAATTNLKVFTIDGRLVKTVLDSWQSWGEHKLNINSKGVKEGVYNFLLELGGLSEVRKMVVLKSHLLFFIKQRNLSSLVVL